MNPYRLYLFAVGMRRLGYSTAFTLVVIYLVREVGASPLELVLPGTAYEVMIFLFEIPTGVVADIYSRRLSIIMGYLLIGIGFMIAGSVAVFGVFVIGMSCAGLGSTFISGALTAWLVDEVGQEDASKAFVRNSQIGILAGLSGIVLSVILGSISLQLTLIAGGVILLVCALILILLMPEDGFQRVPLEERSSWLSLFTTFRQGVTLVRVRKILLWILVASFIIGGFGEAFGKLWQAHVLDIFVLPPLGVLDDIVWFGIMTGIFTPITLLATEWIRRNVDLTDNNAVVRTLKIVTVLLAGSLLLFALSDVLILAVIGLWVTQMFMTMIKPLMQAWTNQHVESNVRATVLSIQGQFNSFGEIIGGPMIGFVATISTIRIALTILVLFLVPLIPVFNHSREEKLDVA